MFHDQLMKDEDDFNQWHLIYGRLSDAVDVSLGKFLEVLTEVENCAHATGNDIHATPVMLMYEFAEPIDGVTVLVRKGSAKNCSQLMRTAFEISLGLRYILEDSENYESRSLAYEYFHLLGGLKWAQKCDPSHEVGKQLRRELEGDELADLFDVDGRCIDIKAEIKQREENLNSARYAIVRSEINRIQDEKRKAKKAGVRFSGSAENWFSLWNGPNDVRSLARRLKMLSQYEALYRNWSSVTHGTGALKRILGAGVDGAASFDPIRSPANLPGNCVHACNLTNGLTLTVVEKLVPQFRENLKDWYINHMKPALGFIGSVQME